MDFLDLMDIKNNEVFNGKYYKDRPQTPLDVPKEFNYDVVNPNDRTYSKILNNLEADNATHAIKTNDFCDFRVNGYVVTHDGLWWQITGFQVIPSKNKQAYRFMVDVVGTEYLLRLIQVENPMEIK